MKYIFFVVTIIFMLFLTGCAALEGIMVDTQEIATTGEANTEIQASLTIIDDFVDKPWDKLVAVGIGYVLALLRRWYKKKQGSKTC